MNFTITLTRSSDETVVAEVPEIPGVLVSSSDAPGARRAVLALALRVLAEQAEFEELEGHDLSFYFEVDMAGKLLIERDFRSRNQAAVCPEVLDQIAAAFDPIQIRLGSLHGSVSETLGSPQRLSRRATKVLETLRRSGWTEHRDSSTHRTLRHAELGILVFPFRDDDVLRNELLDRFSILGGLKQPSRSGYA